ncbi:conserved hypothetical protein [Altererythrobacter sp. B11]|uniref:hypothetical protein n=1 Tax=Altererythrobacter sp. B11 TaxID=2060312 RepID=UPI000DC6F1A0|nr:hypothetical protein [Altererythrobacter sp. B11]BBC71395.1 conserved hypothetical protein [Altererythrobacter sp. B11]
MATAKNRSIGPNRHWPRILLLAVVLLAVLGWYYQAPIRGYTTLGTAFGARTACSCRFVAGRSLSDCKKDFEPGMEMVFLSEDEAAKSVTARVPLIASETARFRRGYGCVLDRWDR